MWAIEHEPICHLFQMFASNLHRNEWFHIRSLNLYVVAWERNKTGMKCVSLLSKLTIFIPVLLLSCRGCLVVRPIVRVSDLTGNNIIFPLQLSDIFYFRVTKQFLENSDLYSTKCFFSKMHQNRWGLGLSPRPR